MKLITLIAVAIAILFIGSAVPTAVATGTSNPYYFQVWQDGIIYSASFNGMNHQPVYVNASVHTSLEFHWTGQYPWGPIGGLPAIGMQVQSQNGTNVFNERLSDKTTIYANLTLPFSSPYYNITLYYGVIHVSHSASSSYGYAASSTDGYTFEYVTNNVTSGSVYTAASSSFTTWGTAGTFELLKYVQAQGTQKFTPIVSATQGGSNEVNGTFDIPSTADISGYQSYSVWYTHNGSNTTTSFKISGYLNNWTLKLYFLGTQYTFYAQAYGPGISSAIVSTSLYMKTSAVGNVSFSLDPASGTVIENTQNVTMEVYPYSSSLSAYYLDGSSSSRVSPTSATDRSGTWTFIWEIDPYDFSVGEHNFTFIAADQSSNVVTASRTYDVNPTFAVSLSFFMTYQLEANRTYEAQFNVSEVDNSSLRTAVINSYQVLYSENNQTVSRNLTSSYYQNSQYEKRSYVNLVTYEPMGNYSLQVLTYNSTSGFEYKTQWSYYLPYTPNAPGNGNNSGGSGGSTLQWYQEIPIWGWTLGTVLVVTLIAAAAAVSSTKRRSNQYGK